MSTSKNQKKKKTFNRLDERFQLKPEHHQDHVFEEEREMVAEMKRRNTSFSSLDDKVLLVFLFARRHNIDASIELLEHHIKMREKVGLKDKLPSQEEVDEILKPGFNIRKDNCYDKYGRMIRYYFFELDLPKGRSPDLYWKYAYWECYHTIKYEPLAAWRNGEIVIVDMQNFGWRNIDLSSTGREIIQSMTSCFPRRIRAMYVVNSGFIFQAVLKASKLILPKKIHKRVKAIPMDELKDLIVESYLHSKYGGKLKLEDEPKRSEHNQPQAHQQEGQQDEITENEVQ